MAQVLDIAIDSTKVSVPRFDPVASYRALSESFGDSSVAMLESVAGPSHAARISHILIAPVLTLRISASSVIFTGEPVLVTAACDTAAAAGFPVHMATVSLPERTDLWRLLRCVRDLFQNPHDELTESFNFGLFGYFGYDIARSIESLPEIIPRTDEVPDAMLSIHSAHAEVEVETGHAYLTCHRAPGWFDAPSREQIEHALVPHGTAVEQPFLSPPTASSPARIEETITRETYLKKVIAAQEHIKAGDIYQVQIGHELRIHTEVSPFDVYSRMRSRNPSPYMFIGTFDGMTIAGSSPEICVRVEGDEVCVRPIAGTIRRGETPEEDSALVAGMLADEKEVAEHVMLVDLARNDVGRVSIPKTLGVDELMIVEQYSHVSHIVSNVVGRLRPDADTFDAIAYTFPAGTVTGAPKIRAMEIIESLENTQRGAYAGAVGLIDFGGYCVTCLGLRSTVHREGVFKLRASAGIVADSQPENEWRETLQKMAAPFWATTGKEIADAGLGG